MAKPMTANEYLAQMKKWGIANKGYRAEWPSHNRTKATGKTFTDVKGVMLHHTGTDATNIGLLWNGYSSLPGPLCHAGCDPKGLVWNVGWGYTNHAGLGDDDILAKVISEEYSGVLRPDEKNTDGNARFYGMEVEYSGSHGMNASQYTTMIRWAAAICDFHDWSEKSVIGHGEWQPGKWDPGYVTGKMMDMNAVRNDIGELLDSGPVMTVPVPPAHTPKVYDLKVGDSIRIGGSLLKVTEVK